MGIVAKYKYDGSVYADLIPEFNDEFTSDLYTVTDEGNIIRDIEWEIGDIDTASGNPRDNLTDHRHSDFIEILPNVRYMSAKPTHVGWYDSNKNYIGYNVWVNEYANAGLPASPSNARYAKFWHGEAHNVGFTVATGEIIRTIESDSLPTLMRFGNNDYSKSLLEVLNMNTSAITSFRFMFRYCNNLTSISCNWDTSKVTDMYCMFQDCYNLATLDVSGWNTSNVVNMYYLFATCCSLTSLDLGKWDFSKNSTIEGIVGNAYSIKTLDISNCNKIPSYTSYAFYNTSSLTDIGMIYCNKEIINEVASLLPTDHNITIWVESDDILQYDQYDHITYKTQKVQDTVHLNSPLLKGDTIEVIDGKTYHVHRSKKLEFTDTDIQSVVSDNGISNVITIKLINNKALFKGWGIKVQSNVIITDTCHAVDRLDANWHNQEDSHFIGVESHGSIWIGAPTTITTRDKAISYLKDNPVNAVYTLASPYYELISEEPLELTLLDTTDNTINNNSILPSNMTIANKELSTIAIKPSTTYTLSFDKSNEDSEVTIDICGGEQITTVLNRVELTTPSELGSGIRFISSDGCIISNVRLLEGSLVEKAIPKETFEGLKSSFDEGYIIGENLVPIGVNYISGISRGATQLKKTILAGTTITIIIHTKQACKSCVRACLQLQDKDGAGTQTTYVGAVNNLDYAINTGYHVSTVRTLTHDLSYINVWFNQVEGIVEYDEIYILEGDHTHLSEAELMRYIEKGTSHYEEEDYNHTGKYKVQYKVTGKNKFDSSKSIFSVNYNSDTQCFKVNPNTTYTYNSSYEGYITLGCYKEYNTKHPGDISNKGNILFSEDVRPPFTITTPPNCNYIWLNHASTDDYFVQIEEGTVATEYEPYKEDIKTYYLSSPLLEGDTIEDVNGVATHVKRYEKVVLDGNIRKMTGLETYVDIDRYSMHYAGVKTDANCTCDKLIAVKGDNEYAGLNKEIVAIRCSTNLIWIYTRKGTYNRDEINQWLQQNPTTVVYQLASPIYEPISTESILLDSYTNGHLDLSNENIPIEKVKFINWYDNLKYLQSNTRYIVQFESDNVGKLDTLGIGGTYLYNQNVVKGLNEFILTTNNTPTTTLSVTGIGFNISNIQVVATDKDIDFDYFKGLKSTFEDGLVTDEADENYGKYKVECKIVGKNKIPYWELGNLNINTGDEVEETAVMRTAWIKVKPNTKYTCNRGSTCFQYDKNKKFISRVYITSFTTYSNTRYIRILGTKDSIESMNIQLEEGTQATPYEPYKESIHTLYLNSPLLKGDKLVVHNGKLCHYHKMDMVVFDGSEDINILDNSNTNTSICSFKLDKIAPSYSIAFCDNFMWIYKYSEDCKHFYVSSNSVLFTLEKTKLSSLTVDGWKQWFQQNPTTVVYKLETPYYEPIEPQLSQYSFSTVKDGDMDIITVLPIEKVNLTYRTDINGVSSIEEQIASVQESTDISSIIDEEVDE